MLDHSQSVVPPPARPLRYGWFERIADWRDGGRDGRAGVLDGQVGSMTTSAVNERVRLFQERAAHERSLMTQDTMAWRARMAELNRQIQDGQRALDQAEQDASAVPRQLPEGQLTQRRGGESGTDDLIVRERNMSRHAAERHSLAKQCADVQQQLDRDRAEYDRIQQEITDREQQMVNQWARLYAYYSRRVMSYTKRLYRVHPDGQYLQAYLPELGQPELEGALNKLLDLTGTGYAGQPSIPGPQPARPGKQALTPRRRAIGRRRSI